MKKASAEPSIIALLHGPDRPGLVARVAGWIFERGGNIIHADQHRDPEEGIFFQRVEWTPAGGAERVAGEIQDFDQLARNELGMACEISTSRTRQRIALFVSKIPHCFHDIILRTEAGELDAEIACVISNHDTMRAAAARYGLPYHHVPVTRETKRRAESEQARLCRENKVDLVVLARYMQVLTAEFIDELAVPVINIHHSFLPAFAGGRPYHQAHRRGVKIIGATAHYATEDLDEGPIIHQDVTRVNHRHSVADLTRRGRDLEKVVLAQAIRWHLNRRILVYHNKTVVFE